MTTGEAVERFLDGARLFDWAPEGTQQRQHIATTRFLGACFLRADSPSGLSPALPAVSEGDQRQLRSLLVQAIERDVIRPTEAGWRFLLDAYGWKPEAPETER
jgi:hypothetical protein